MTALVIRLLAALAAAAYAVPAVAAVRFRRRVGREVGALLADARDPSPATVTPAMLDGLPDPVRRFLTYSGVVGQAIPRTVRLEQVGTIRRRPADPPRPLEAVQYYSVDPPAFIWIATMRQGKIPVVRGRDRYLGGRGLMEIKLGALVNLVRAEGEEIDQGAFLRYLSEMIWFPAAFLGRNVRFEAVDHRTARVTLTDRTRSVTGTLHVDDAGKLTAFSAERYMLRNGGGATLETWWAPVTRYGEFEGLRLPVGAKAIWKLAEGDLEYIDLTVTKLAYNVDRVY